MEGKADHQTIVYEEFEPYCKWDHNEDRDTIEIHLKEFKKDQLKVQISNWAILKIFGERQSNASMKSKFYKEIPVPSNVYDKHAIQAKFTSGCLSITLPKQKTLVLELNKCTSPDELKIDQSPKCVFQLAKATMAAATATGVAAGAVAVLVPCVVYMCKSAICQFVD
ncbi:hypothetical protein CDL12_25004 [Handroanthus impetiginosus]|uniref:SHSP domain-containing protein n=1 Tax=Handroanthus impetiginosus TaxID=429701 RepID=A0A2G9GB13_9LAMI|nr:hypothetical protein CDL12_25004 [Handroanthus impetiginosus]